MVVYDFVQLETYLHRQTNEPDRVQLETYLYRAINELVLVTWPLKSSHVTKTASSQPMVVYDFVQLETYLHRQTNEPDRVQLETYLYRAINELDRDRWRWVLALDVSHFRAIIWSVDRIKGNFFSQRQALGSGINQFYWICAIFNCKIKKKGIRSWGLESMSFTEFVSTVRDF